MDGWHKPEWWKSTPGVEGVEGVEGAGASQFVSEAVALDDVAVGVSAHRDVFGSIHRYYLPSVGAEREGWWTHGPARGSRERSSATPARPVIAGLRLASDRA